jgi:hypothetical protein
MYANRFFTLMVVAALAAVVILTVGEAIASNALAESVHRNERSRAADTARWQTMGEYYAS